MCDSVYVNLQTFLHTMCANARQMILANSYGHKSAIFDQEAKIVFMDIRFACRHLCVCVVGYVTKWGICPSGSYLNYSISCPRRPDLIEVARGVWSSHTSLGTSGEQFEQFLLKNIEYRPQWGIGTVNYYNNGITAIGTSAITYVHSTNPGTNTNTLAITNK